MSGATDVSAGGARFVRFGERDRSSEKSKATSSRFKRAVSVLLIEMSTPTPKIYCNLSGPTRKFG
jgi:hypothetical protein